MLADPELRHQIEGALSDVATGRADLVPHEEVKCRLAARQTVDSDPLALRRILGGGGRTAWSVFYVRDAGADQVTIVGLSPPGVPVVPLVG